MKKLLACLFMVMVLQTAAFADAETDMHQLYIAQIQAQKVHYHFMHILCTLRIDFFLHFEYNKCTERR